MAVATCSNTTTHLAQRGYAATKESEYYLAKTQRRKVRSQKLPNLGVWQLSAKNIRIREFPTFTKFAQTAKTLSHSNTRFFPDCAEKKRFALSATATTEIRNVSRKDAKAAKVGEKW